MRLDNWKGEPNWDMNIFDVQDISLDPNEQTVLFCNADGSISLGGNRTLLPKSTPRTMSGNATPSLSSPKSTPPSKNFSQVLPKKNTSGSITTSVSPTKGSVTTIVQPTPTARVNQTATATDTSSSAPISGGGGGGGGQTEEPKAEEAAAEESPEKKALDTKTKIIAAGCALALIWYIVKRWK